MLAADPHTRFTPAVFVTLTCALLHPAAVAPQTRRQVITESTATIGRGGALASNGSSIAGVAAVADLGLRWVRPSGMGLGVSLLGGRDFPNEATLVGVRLRLSRTVGRGMLEGAITGIASSAGSGGLGHASGLGGSLGLAYYPVAATALVMQLDMIPTYHYAAVPGPDGATEDLTRRPALSGGVRLAGRTGVLPWLGAGIVGALAVLIND